MAITVTIPHLFFNKSGNVPATQLDEDFAALATAVNALGGAVGGSGVRGQTLISNPGSPTGSGFFDAPLHVGVFGALPGASPSVNRVSIQAAVDALPPNGGALYFSRGLYQIDGGITVNKSVYVYGEGDSTIIQQMTAAASIWEVTSTEPCFFRDLVLAGIGSTSTGSAIHFDTGGPANTGSHFRGVRFFQIGEGIHFEQGAYWFCHECDFILINNNGIYQRNPNFTGDEGDMSVSGCLFNASTGPGSTLPNHFFWQSGGGVNIQGTKFLGGARGILIFPQDAGVTTGLLLVTGSSIEQFTVNGLEFIGSVGSFLGVSVAGCEFGNFRTGGPACINVNHPIAHSMAITGSVFHLLDGSKVGIALLQGDRAIVEGNTFTAFTMDSTIAVLVSGSYTNAVIGENNYFNVFQPINNSSQDTRINTMLQVPAAGLGVLSAGSGARAGSMVWCSDCVPGSSPCTGGADGALAQWKQGAWRCYNIP